jgi:hypothetical protein
MHRLAIFVDVLDMPFDQLGELDIIELGQKR